MKPMVVLFALAAVACGSLVPVAQPPHHPAILLDPHGRPLDTAEVINNRAVHLQAKALEGHYAPLAHAAPLLHAAPIAHSVVAAPALVAAPAAVSHQSRVDVHTSHGAPLLAAHSAYGAPLLGHGLAGHGLAGHGHWLKKRSLGHLAYSAPVIAPSAVSHQSRVDVISSPAVVSHAVAAPVVAHAAPVVAHAVPAAVSHQSRVDVRTSPAVVATYAAPAHHGVALAAPLAHHGLYHSAPLVHSAPYVHSSPLVHGW